jgi:asparagine synthase (glutamine-hydrolysing)
MCGIAGVYNNNDDSLIKRMTGLMGHRGPDDEGFFEDDKIALGHRRLSIIDLSARGHQPMERDNLVIVYNGEIYNYIELRKELERKGYVFSSGTDTEVILFAFKEWGKDCLSKFNGMWAFAIWDKEKKELFCSRDRYGIKPFYYYFNGSVFAFSSELRPLLLFRKEPNEKAIFEYLTAELADYSSQTFFEGIKQLEPASYLFLKDNAIKKGKYYEIRPNFSLGVFSEKKAKEYAEEFLELLEDSVRLRLRSDVETGSCLSGGLDSSTIVSLINKLKKETGQKTFSFYSNDPAIDERKYIKEILKDKNIDSYYVYCSGKDFWPEIQKVVQDQEEPFKSTSVYAQWKVMELANKNNVKVLLDGQGADELFGYPEQAASFFNQSFLKARALPRINGSWLRFFLPSSFIYYLRKKRIEELNFLKPALEKKYKYSERMSRSSRVNFQQALLEGMTDCGLKRLLRYEDKDSMAFSIESRIPFLDFRVVDFIFSLPAVYKFHNGFTKYLLRRACKGIIPEDVRLRKNKLGFAVPEEKWLSENRANILDIFKGRDFCSSVYVDKSKIIRKLEDKNSAISGLWRFINLELWLRKF